jgi:hypothetical protein
MDPLIVSQEKAVEQFAQLMAPYLDLASPSVESRAIFDTVLSFYREVRIEGTNLDHDDDMLLLQWGATKPLLIDGFTDLRPLADEHVKMADRAERYISITRQIFVEVEYAEDVEFEILEFDDLAIGLTVALFFGPAGRREPSSNLWIATPADVQVKMEEFSTVPYVNDLLDSQPLRINVYVDAVG